MLGMVGILLALVLFMVCVYKGYSNYYVAPICVILVALTNAMDPVEAFTSLYVNGMVNMIVTIFSMIFLGAIFGKIFSDTGAAQSIANFLLKKMVLKKEGDTQIRLAIVAVIVLGGICTLGGIDGYTQYFLFAPICLAILEKANIPRRFLPAILALNTAFIACPGVPQIYNVIMIGAFASTGNEVKSTAGLIPGLVGVAVVLVGSYLVLTRMVIKARKSGEIFDWGTLEKCSIQENNIPNIVVAFIPLIVTFIIYTILNFNIAVALTCGILSNLILMGKYINYKEEGTRWLAIKNTLNRGAGAFPNSIFSLCVPSGLAAVITATAAFGETVGILTGMKINLIVLTVIAMCILVAITSSPPVALMIVIPLVVQVGVASGTSLNLPAIARVAALAATTFETLPTNGAVLLGLSLAKTTHKESYKPVFLETCICTFLGTVVCAAIYLLMPNLP